MTKEEDISIRKAIEAIAINPRTGRITLLTRKLFNVLLHHAMKDGLGGEVYRVPIGEILSNCAYDSNDSEFIKDHLRKMNAIQVEWNSVGQGGTDTWGVSTLLASAKITIDRNARSTWVSWSYSPEIRERLLRPEIYARMSLRHQASMRSSSGLALYEICARYSSSPSGLTMRQPWEWWRPVLTGIPEADAEVDVSYKEYKYFKRNVIKGSVAEVNAVTDLDVELIEFKEGRRIKEIQFRVRKKAQSKLNLVQPDKIDMALYSRLMRLPLSQREADQIFGEAEEDAIRNTLKALETRMANAGLTPVDNPGAWFKAALRSEMDRPRSKPAEKPARPAISKDKLLGQYQEHRRGEAEIIYKEMPESDRTTWDGNFLAHLNNSEGNAVVLREYEKKGLKSKIASVAFYAWLANQWWGAPTADDLLNFALSGKAKNDID